METLSEEHMEENELSTLLTSASELYNLCRIHMKEAEKNQYKKEACSLLKIRYCCCILLHASTLHPIFHNIHSKYYSKKLLTVVPDVLRAYQHTSRLLKQYQMMDAYDQSFKNGMMILDQMEPLLQQSQGVTRNTRFYINSIDFYSFKEAEYYLLMDWMNHLLSRYQDDDTNTSCYDLLLRIHDECIQYLPDLRLSFITQLYKLFLLTIRYNAIGTYHKAGKWKQVITWGSKTMEFIEKVTTSEYDDIRDKIIYLLANGYIKNHEESKSIVCLQLCSKGNTIQIHYLYLLYYIAINNISFYHEGAGS